MSWYIENHIIGENTDTLTTVNGNSITGTLTLSQDGNKITLDLGGILELYQVLQRKGIIVDIVNF